MQKIHNFIQNPIPTKKQYSALLLKIKICPSK